MAAFYYYLIRIATFHSPTLDTCFQKSSLRKWTFGWPPNWTTTDIDHPTQLDLHLHKHTHTHIYIMVQLMYTCIIVRLMLTECGWVGSCPNFGNLLPIIYQRYQGIFMVPCHFRLLKNSNELNTTWFVAHLDSEVNFEGVWQMGYPAVPLRVLSVQLLWRCSNGDGHT